jgi:deoxycytidylate deaminase
MIINAGLTRVVYVGAYHDEIAMRYLKLAGVTIDHFDWGERAPASPPNIKQNQK